MTNATVPKIGSKWRDAITDNACVMCEYNEVRVTQVVSVVNSFVVHFSCTRCNDEDYLSLPNWLSMMKPLDDTECNPIKCECGGVACNTTHSSWCPAYA